MKDGAQLPAADNATPVEVDQLYESITELSTALGPDGGANADGGAFAGLLDTGGAKNLKGNGKDIGDSIEQFGKATKTLDKSSGNLFDTLSYLQTFTTMLKDNDGNVRAAEEQLNSVTGFLADDKKNLGAALKELGTALGQVKTFIKDNRGGELKKNVDASCRSPRPSSTSAPRWPSRWTSCRSRRATSSTRTTPPSTARSTAGPTSTSSAWAARSWTPPWPSRGFRRWTPSGNRRSPALPLPAVGTVYGTPPKDAKAAKDAKGAKQ